MEAMLPHEHEDLAFVGFGVHIQFNLHSLHRSRPSVIGGPLFAAEFGAWKTYTRFCDMGNRISHIPPLGPQVATLSWRSP